jgi:hypothetical protein
MGASWGLFVTSIGWVGTTCFRDSRAVAHGPRKPAV